MPKMLQVRDVPDEFHRRLKARAALEGMSMSEYVLRELRKSLETPTRDELLRRVRGAAPRRLRTSPTAVIRAQRDAR